MTGYMILEYEFKDMSFIEICGPNIKFWEGTGLPTYEGGWEGFETIYPSHIAELLKNKITKAK